MVSPDTSEVLYKNLLQKCAGGFSLELLQSRKNIGLVNKLCTEHPVFFLAVDVVVVVRMVRLQCMLQHVMEVCR